MTRHQHWPVPVVVAVLLALATFVAFCVFNGSATSLHEFPLDDGWIHQVYVRGILTEGAPTYNPGVPEAGFSSPLWLLASIPFHLVGNLIGATPVVPIKIASLVFAVLAALGIGRLAQRMSSETDGRRAGIIAVGGTLLAPGFAFSAVSGMEVSLAAAVLAWALVCLAEKRLRTTGILLGCATIARPEAALVPIIVAVVWLLRRRGHSAENHAEKFAADPLQTRLPPRISDAVVLLGPTLLLASAWATYNLFISGHPLPNTFYVKAGAGELGLGESARFLGSRILFDAGWAPGIAMLVLAGLGVMIAWRKGSRSVVAATLATILLASLAILATHPLFTLVLSYSQGYFYPFTILTVAFAAVGWAHVSAHIRARKPRAATAVSALAALAALGLLAPGLTRARDRYAAHCHDIDVLHRQPALDARALLPANSLLAVEGAGAARFFSGMRVLDLVGLNDHRLAQATGDPELKNCIIADAGPELVLVPEAWLINLAPGFELQTVLRYEVKRWSVVGGHGARAVVAARAKLRPSVVPYCMQVLKRARIR